MRAYDLIKKKRDGYELSEEEIKYFFNGYEKGEIANYQVSAMLMAIYFNGMSENETLTLTEIIADSGDKVKLIDIKGIRADKHSTGGVGDKTSLIVAPIIASLGIKVAKMSGRGLGHTGGTVDKLSSIKGFNVNLSEQDFEKQVKEIGLAIIGQTKNLAPLDKKLYELRDVTATVDSIPLIASSIMGKKLTADDDVIVLDVKTGSGSFMKTEKESKMLAEEMVKIGKNAGKKTVALITDMNQPLGVEIGNALEVVEAINVLKGNGDERLINLCIALSANILVLAKKGSYAICEKLAKFALQSGRAYDYFLKMVKSQGGDVNYLENIMPNERAKYYKEVKVLKSGYIVSINTEGYGLAAASLGAGRNKIEDEIDYLSGITVCKTLGDKVEENCVIAKIYSNDKNSLEIAENIILNSVTIGNSQPIIRDIIIDTIV